MKQNEIFNLIIFQFRQCGRYIKPNYYTSTEECPPNFEKYILKQSTQTENLFRRDCHSCGFLWLFTCCNDIPDGIGMRRLTFYGCNKNQNQLRSSTGVLKITNDYVFGGSFTGEKMNPVTGTGRCPNDPFQEDLVTDGFKVCLAERVRDTDDLPHYGGIYSCNRGNIALNGSKRECLPGYSVYVMGAIEDGCLLFVCLKFDRFPEIRELPQIVLPPFLSIPLRNQTRIIGNLSDFDGPNTETTTSYTPKSDKLTFGLSIGGLGIGALAIVLVTVFLVHSKRQRRRQQPNHTNDVPLEQIANA